MLRVTWSFWNRRRTLSVEAILQEALATHPEVLAGSTTSGRGGRLLLIKREAGVPTAEGGAQTFSLDHLFVDAQAVPVIVEVKRSSDTRIRREVVGQMLDYAANGQRYWSVAALAEQVARDAEGAGTSLEAMLGELGFEGEADAFWSMFEENLRTGNVRLVFVADRLPPELIRIIEFLNAQMRPAEVLGVELIQYRGSGAQVLVPRVVGITQQAADVKTSTGGPKWERSSFLEVAAERCSPREVEILERLIDHATGAGRRASWGKGAAPGLSGWYTLSGVERPVWNANTGAGGPSSGAYAGFYVKELRMHLDDELFEAFTGRLQEMSALAPQLEKARRSGWMKGMPYVQLSRLSDADVERLFDALDLLVA